LHGGSIPPISIAKTKLLFTGSFVLFCEAKVLPKHAMEMGGIEKGKVSGKRDFSCGGEQPRQSQVLRTDWFLKSSFCE